MDSQFSRSEMIFGSDNMKKLSNARVIVFGVGGVGGYVVEGLVRSGIGAIDIVDDDVVCLSNLNRQIISLQSNIGEYKVDVAEKRIHEINPECKVTKFRCFFLPETAGNFDFSLYDYVVDCIDTVSGKIQIVMQAKEAGVPVISSMGAGNKVNPAMLEVDDIYNTSVCPLARVMRRELKDRGVESLKVVYSKEEALEVFDSASSSVTEGADGSEVKNIHGGKRAPGSNVFVPGTAGLLIASEVVKDITDFHKTEIKRVRKNKTPKAVR